MARADTRTLLPLDTFAKIMGMNPLHFNGVYSSQAPVTTCGQPLTQYSWQSANAVSREDVAQAIAEAEERISQYTRFKLAPTFIVDERQAWPRPYMPELYNAWMTDVRGQSAAVKTNWGYIIAGGVEGRTPIATNVPVVYTDTDGDGFKETARISVATSVTDPNEIALVYPGESGNPEWEVRPIDVSFASGVVTITVRRSQLLNPGFMTSLSPRGADGEDDALFLANADVYRVFHDPSQQVQMLWENRPSMCGCESDVCQTCYVKAQYGCSLVRDYRTGLVTASPAAWNSVTYAYEGVPLAVWRAPDRVRLWYRSGYRDATLKRSYVEMKPQFARAVAYMAAALLARPMCQCQNVTAQVEHWMTDLARVTATPGASENFRVNARTLDNPFGTTRGAIHAWRTFQRESIGEAVLV